MAIEAMRNAGETAGLSSIMSTSIGEKKPFTKSCRRIGPSPADDERPEEGRRGGGKGHHVPDELPTLFQPGKRGARVAAAEAPALQRHGEERDSLDGLDQNRGQDGKIRLHQLPPPTTRRRTRTQP